MWPRASRSRLRLICGSMDVTTLPLDLERGVGNRASRSRRNGSPVFISPQPLLARERVRYVGDPVALVVAETLVQAKDAAELIEIEFEPLSSVTSTAAAIAPGAPAVWEGCPDNQAFLHELGNK